MSDKKKKLPVVIVLIIINACFMVFWYRVISYPARHLANIKIALTVAMAIIFIISILVSWGIFKKDAS